MKLLLFAVLALLAPLAVRAAEPAQRWYVILTENGTPIGYASRETAPTGEGREVVDSQVLNLAEEGPPTTLTPWSGVVKGDEVSGRTKRREDKDGRTLVVDA